jgi:hypothetical protein
MAKEPYEQSRQAKYLQKRVLAFRPRKPNGAIAEEAGFINPNMTTIPKTGVTKLPVRQLGGTRQCARSK